MVTVQLKKDHGFGRTVLTELSSDNCSTVADGCSLVNLDEDKPVKVLLSKLLDSHNSLTEDVGMA